MSWFQDLAGKAEDFLNKVDQSAAHALHNKETKKKNRNTTSSYDGAVCIAEIEHAAIPLSSSVPYNLNQCSTLRTNFESNDIFVQPAKPEVRDSDQKFFDYLNSDSTCSNLPNFQSETVPNDICDKGNEGRTEEKVDHHTFNGHQSDAENEKQMLHNEVKSLNQEMIQALSRAKTSEKEQKLLKTQNDNLKTQVNNLNKQVNELSNQLKDMYSSLTAKDTQLGVLRIRLEESDDEVKNLKGKMEYFVQENNRLNSDCSVSSDSYNQTLKDLNNRLQETEKILEQERLDFHNSHSKLMDSLSQLESQQITMSNKISDYKRLLKEEKQLSEDNRLLVQQYKTQLETQRDDFQEYKMKAQKILLSKENLISELKQKGFDGACDDKEIYEVEFDQLRQEKELLKQEIEQLNTLVVQLKSDLSECENQAALQASHNFDEIQTLQSLLSQKDSKFSELEADLKFEREAALNSRNEFIYNEKRLSSLLSDKENEVLSLRRQLTTKKMSSSTEEELEARLRALTESLIQKQTLLEALSTEKNSLMLQLERIENQKMEPVGSRLSSSTFVNTIDNAKPYIPSFMTESPYDGSVTRNVKRAYSSLDMFSMRIGVFFKRFPVSRVFILIYMGLLHLWVLCVLLTYTPEIHPS